MDSILLDLDETFLVSKYALAAAVEKEHGIKTNPDKWTTYKMSEVYGLPVEDIIAAWIKHKAIQHGPYLAPGSFELYQYCVSRGVRIEFITARGFDPDAESRTIENLKFNGIRREHYTLTIVSGSDKKSEYFQSDNPILYADDSAEQTMRMKRDHPFIHTLLVEQPHNQPVRDDALRMGSHLTTVKNMYDVLDVLTHIRAYRTLTKGMSGQMVL